MKGSIRPMRAADWEKVIAIFYQGMVSNMATFETVCPSYAQWDEEHLKICRYVLEVSGDVVGWVALSPVSKRTVFRGIAEVSIYIENGHKGKGYGEALLYAVTQVSEEEGFWMLQSNIMADNFPSLRLHKKCGFREVGYRERQGQDRHGKWRDTILMERRKVTD
ncbi:MAG: GNAT family N-acetyltransferase [Cellulosilyticaceae bacterium]